MVQQQPGSNRSNARSAAQKAQSESKFDLANVKLEQLSGKEKQVQLKLKKDIKQLEQMNQENYQRTNLSFRQGGLSDSNRLTSDRRQSANGNEVASGYQQKPASEPKQEGAFSPKEQTANIRPAPEEHKDNTMNPLVVLTEGVNEIDELALRKQPHSSLPPLDKKASLKKPKVQITDQPADSLEVTKNQYTTMINSDIFLNEYQKALNLARLNEALKRISQREQFRQTMKIKLIK